MPKKQATLSTVHTKLDDIIPTLRAGITHNEDGSLTIGKEAVDAAIAAQGTTTADLKKAQEVTTNITAAALGVIGEATHNVFADPKKKDVETVDFNFAVGHSKTEGQALRQTTINVPGSSETKDVQNRLNQKTHISYGQSLNKNVLKAVAALQELDD